MKDIAEIYESLVVTLKMTTNILMRKNIQVKMKMTQTIYWNN